MTELYDYPKYSCPFKRGYAFTEDGEYFAFGVSASGSDWVEIKFLQVDGAVELKDTLERVKFSCMSWTHDGKGLFYNCYPTQDGKSDGTETSTNLDQKLYYHVLGTPQSEDILCAEFLDNPKWMGGAEVSDDGRYIFLSIREGCDPVNRLWYCDLQKVPEGIKEFSSCVHSMCLFICFLHDVKNVLKMYHLQTGVHLKTVPLDVGSVVGFTGCKKDSEIFYYFTSFFSPGT
ncbi:UNVERIFIED_CONTAM: hypothetical protein FKN15_034834 [Acipenser sinensis]